MKVNRFHIDIAVSDLDDGVQRRHRRQLDGDPAAARREHDMAGRQQRAHGGQLDRAGRPRGGDHPTPSAAGVLHHPTSLPGRFGIGDLGDELLLFLDWAKEAGLHIWQVLPLNAPGYGNSPYGCLSSYAGNPLLISPQRLFEAGLLPDDALNDLPELPAVVHVTEVSHLHGGKALCFGGGLYIDPVFPDYDIKAIVSRTPETGKSALMSVE